MPESSPVALLPMYRSSTPIHAVVASVLSVSVRQLKSPPARSNATSEDAALLADGEGHVIVGEDRRAFDGDDLAAGALDVGGPANLAGVRVDGVQTGLAAGAASDGVQKVMSEGDGAAEAQRVAHPPDDGAAERIERGERTVTPT